MAYKVGWLHLRVFLDWSVTIVAKAKPGEVRRADCAEKCGGAWEFASALAGISVPKRQDIINETSRMVANEKVDIGFGCVRED